MRILTSPQTKLGPSKLDLLLNINQIANQPLDFFIEMQKRYGDIYPFQFPGAVTYHAVSHPDHIRQVLVTQQDKFIKDRTYSDTQRGLRRFLGDGLLTSEGSYWKKQRKLVAPAFHHQRIARYAETFVDITDMHTADWQDGQQLDMNDEMRAITLNIVSQALIGTRFEEDLRLITHSLELAQQMAGKRYPLPSFIAKLLMPSDTDLNAADAALGDIIQRFINDWRVEGCDRGDLLSMLMLVRDEDGIGMTDAQLHDELLTFFSAGHESTANTLAWTWYLLAQHPETEARLHHELDTVLGGRLATFEDIPNLPYTDMVLKESMRLYPPAWALARQATDDVWLGDYLIQKGEGVAILIYLAQHDGRWFDVPEAFFPSRFAPSRADRIPKYAYLPFGAGPRVCIANGFATLEAVLVLATIASRYRVRLAQPPDMVKPAPMVTLSPSPGMPVTLYERL